MRAFSNCFKRVLEIQEKNLISDHSNLSHAGWVAYARWTLAVLLEIEDRADEAGMLETQAMELLRHQPRIDNSATALQLTKEGNKHFENGGYILAEDRYWSALDFYVKTLGPDAANVAQLWENLSRAVAKQGREKEAAVYTRRAQRIRQGQGK